MPPLKVRKYFLNRYIVKNEIPNLYILLKSELKKQEMPFQRPTFQNLSGGIPLDPPTIVSSLWPPPHYNSGYATVFNKSYIVRAVHHNIIYSGQKYLQLKYCI